jgi:predicted CXXCH cytochrome family protein
MRWNPLPQRLWPFSFLLISLFLFSANGAPAQQSSREPVATKSEVDPAASLLGQDCVPCHAEIVRTYSKTSMANASGTAIHALIPGEFTHATSGVRYRIYEENGKAWLDFDRDTSDPVHGKRELSYFIGSAQRGRTYLFSEDGYVFESPVNWYAQNKTWDMTPAYKSATHIPLNLPAAVSCFHCHTSGFHPPAPGTENKYQEPLFSQHGISCERCHGNADAHAKGSGSVMNPSKLSPARRDAICMQCHLEGSAAIEQPGKHIYDFKAGEDLSEFVHYLVLSTEKQANPRAVSQFEALAESMCKRKSGDALHCTTCHDPHGSPAPTERVSFYRAKCLQCHGERFAAKHNPKNPDCVWCHMPRISSSDVAHTQATDHRILREPAAATPQAFSEAAASRPKLEMFPPQAGLPTNRDLALGWLALAESGRNFAEVEEENVLPVAAKEFPGDAAVLSAYAYRELIHKRTQHAKELYEAALGIDPLNLDAAVNLGVIEAQSGSADRALALWRDTFHRAPWRSSIGMNLARLSCNLGNREEAEQSLHRVLQFNPDFPEARQFLHGLESQSVACDSR